MATASLLAEPKRVGAYVSLLQATAGVCAMLTLTARNGTSDVPLRDLTPYLAAPMHVFVVSADLQWSSHLHGMVAADMEQSQMGCDAHTMTMPPVEFASPVSAHTIPMSVLPKPAETRCPNSASKKPSRRDNIHEGPQRIV
jgi:hypothetical protein